jgi:hypothetical protein
VKRSIFVAAVVSPVLLGHVVSVDLESPVGAARAAEMAKVCRFPHLTGLVLTVARERASKAGCNVRVVGAIVERPEIQTIRTQSPSAGHHGRIVTVWLNPLCSGSADWGPPRGEPFLVKGPSELVSGLYLDGGPHRFRSAPRCESLSGIPGAGTITVTNPATGVTVATQGVARGHLARIPLPSGTYTVRGVFGDAISNGQHPRSFPVTVQIPPATTLRQDLVLNIP